MKKLSALQKLHFEELAFYDLERYERQINDFKETNHWLPEYSWFVGTQEY